jgi:hypothetical protein
VIAPGISPKPLNDLIFHGGKLVPQMEFQNVFLAVRRRGKPPTSTSSTYATTLAMQDVKLNNVIRSTNSCRGTGGRVRHPQSAA